MTTFEEAIATAGLPEAATEPIRKAWDQAFGLISENNTRIAQINAAKAQDPSNTEYLDTLWKLHAKNDSEMSQVEEQFYEVAEMYEKLNLVSVSSLRRRFRRLSSEDETKNAKKLVAESSDAIKTARDKYLAMAGMFDGILGSMGKGIDGGLASLLPEADSLKSLRGRRAATGEKSNITRIGAAEINGKNIHRDGKANFRYLADGVSSLFGANTYPENKVTGEELEEAFFQKLEKPYRSLKSTELPDSTTFTFTKEVKTGENTTEKKSVNITIKKAESSATTSTPAEKAPEAKPEPAKKATPTKPATQKS